MYSWRICIIQKSIVVKVQIVDGGLDNAELNVALAEGWKVCPDQPPATSTPGSILYIVQKE